MATSLRREHLYGILCSGVKATPGSSDVANLLLRRRRFVGNKKDVFSAIFQTSMFKLLRPLNLLISVNFQS